MSKDLLKEIEEFERVFEWKKRKEKKELMRVFVPSIIKRASPVEVRREGWEIIKKIEKDMIESTDIICAVIRSGRYPREELWKFIDFAKKTEKWGIVDIACAVAESYPLPLTGGEIKKLVQAGRYTSSVKEVIAKKLAITKIDVEYILVGQGNSNEVFNKDPS